MIELTVNLDLTNDLYSPFKETIKRSMDNDIHIGEEVFGTLESAKDNEEINRLHDLRLVMGSLNDMPRAMKTKGQRQAELELVLQGA
jgi:hypothetical protein